MYGGYQSASSLSPFPQTATYGNPYEISYAPPRPAFAPHRQPVYHGYPVYEGGNQSHHYDGDRHYDYEWSDRERDYERDYDYGHAREYDDHRDRSYGYDGEHRQYSHEDRPTTYGRERERAETEAAPQYVRPEPPRPIERERSPPRADVDDTKSSFSLALSEVTTVTSDMQLTLAEELMLMKAGDNPKFSRNSETLDISCAAALLLDLVCLGRVEPDSQHAVTPSNYVLRVRDASPTGSKLLDSGISNLSRKPKQPPTVLYWMQKASVNLSQSVLWRLVKKSKLDYDPRTFGSDKYPVRAFDELTALREKIMAIMEGNKPDATMHELFLAFLYYLPNDVSSQVFGDRDDSLEDAHLVAKAVVLAFKNFQKTKKNWI
eukprot:TRINITY_DN7115_c1_g1_i1.p1 TRINITY_DN7115_c1_g1~~TRINITY_DN7115_c1_g1_i1.p1  ORF type:complete len:376 (+),score=37.70 TRINITY_DN7115_c1_g1_i1:1-1128(+)